MRKEVTRFNFQKRLAMYALMGFKLFFVTYFKVYSFTLLVLERNSKNSNPKLCRKKSGRGFCDRKMILENDRKLSATKRNLFYLVFLIKGFLHRKLFGKIKFHVDIVKRT